MKDRCYNPKCHAYKSYGARGVRIAEEWDTLNKFISTVDLVDGFNYESFMKGELFLDKDIKDINAKLYSIDTCSFVSMSDNNKAKPNQQRPIIATSTDGVAIEFINQSDFARQHGLRQSTISECLKGDILKHKGWTFQYK